RCGTNFLLIVLVMSVFAFSLFGGPPFLERGLLHLLLMPAVAGSASEIIRHAARDAARPAAGWLATPGLWMQRLTTRPPARDQLEVAIAALERVLVRDGALAADVTPEAAYVGSTGGAGAAIYRARAAPGGSRGAAGPGAAAEGREGPRGPGGDRLPLPGVQAGHGRTASDPRHARGAAGTRTAGAGQRRAGAP